MILFRSMESHVCSLHVIVHRVKLDCLPHYLYQKSTLKKLHVCFVVTLVKHCYHYYYFVLTSVGCRPVSAPQQVRQSLCQHSVCMQTSVWSNNAVKQVQTTSRRQAAAMFLFHDTSSSTDGQKALGILGF